MSEEKQTTGRLAKAINRNHKKANVPEIIGQTDFQRAVNRNRKNAGLKMLEPEEFKSQSQNNEEE